jgi:hypothetical protein
MGSLKTKVMLLTSSGKNICILTNKKHTFNSHTYMISTNGDSIDSGMSIVIIYSKPTLHYSSTSLINTEERNQGTQEE